MSERDELAEVDGIAKALYVEACWAHEITEPDAQRKPRSEYERKAGDRWDAGKAGYSPHQMFARYAQAVIAAGYRKVEQ